MVALLIFKNLIESYTNFSRVFFLLGTISLELKICLKGVSEFHNQLAKRGNLEEKER